MHHQSDASRPALEYAATRPRWPWKQYFLGVVTLPAIYLCLYLVMRVVGVYHPYFSQGSWEIEGGTGIYVLDVPFVPLVIVESDLQNRLRWLPEPTGG